NVVVNGNPDVSNLATGATTPVCAGSPSAVTVTSSSLGNGTFTVTYDLSAPNASTGNTASLAMSGGTGTFNTLALANAGTTTITITSIQNSSNCGSPFSRVNRANVVVNGNPDVSNFSTSASTPVVQGAASTVTVNSTSLGNGTFTVTYDLSA